MKLSELIAKIGDGNVEMQILSECLAGRQKAVRGGIHITFGTAAVGLHDLIADSPRKIGVVVWIPYDKFKELLSDEKRLAAG